MSKKHTPGPWIAAISETDRLPMIPPMMSEFKIIALGSFEWSYKPIARLNMQGSESRNNAHLIAAAPDMLAELEADEDASQLSPVDFFKKHGYNISERGDRRRAIIAKAKGAKE